MEPVGSVNKHIQFCLVIPFSAQREQKNKQQQQKRVHKIQLTEK